MSLLNKFSIKDFILSSKEAYQKELKKGMGSQIGKSLFNKFSIEDIILSSKEAYQSIKKPDNLLGNLPPTYRPLTAHSERLEY